jgi:hypothetical protein
MKRKVHRAFVEELPVGHPCNFEDNPGMVAFCEETLEHGSSADTRIEVRYWLAPGCVGAIERAVYYLDGCCKDARHVL